MDLALQIVSVHLTPDLALIVKHYYYDPLESLQSVFPVTLIDFFEAQTTSVELINGRDFKLGRVATGTTQYPSTGTTQFICGTWSFDPEWGRHLDIYDKFGKPWLTPNEFESERVTFTVPLIFHLGNEVAEGVSNQGNGSKASPNIQDWVNQSLRASLDMVTWSRAKEMEGKGVPNPIAEQWAWHKRHHGCILSLKLKHGDKIHDLFDDPSCTPDYCLLGACLVLMADGTHKPASELRAGDRVLTGSSEVSEVEATVQSVVNRRTQMAAFGQDNSCVLTPGHPILLHGETFWCRAKSRGALQSMYVPAVYNFVLQNRSGLLVRMGRDHLLVSTLGQFCLGVDEPTSMFGSERVVHSLRSNPTWPNMTFQGRRGAEQSFGAKRTKRPCLVNL